MVVVPADMPVATPVEDPMVATDGVLLVHVPPEGAPNSEVTAPVHTEAMPTIADGIGFTVTARVVLQPVARV